MRRQKTPQDAGLHPLFDDLQVWQTEGYSYREAVRRVLRQRTPCRFQKLRVRERQVYQSEGVPRLFICHRVCRRARHVVLQYLRRTCCRI
jgi:hypothetical protein